MRQWQWLYDHEPDAPEAIVRALSEQGGDRILEYGPASYYLKNVDAEPSGREPEVVGVGHFRLEFCSWSDPRGYPFYAMESERFPLFKVSQAEQDWQRKTELSALEIGLRMLKAAGDAIDGAAPVD